MKSILLSILAFSLLCLNVQAQTNEKSNYNPQDLFAPNFYEQGSSITRAANGSPNEGYWQNKVDYTIAVSLNDQTNKIEGNVVVDYTNNSPQELKFLWLQLDQNLFAADSRGQARMPVGSRSRYGDASSNFDGGYKFGSVKINNQVADYIITDTRMQIRLKEPLKARGGKIKINLDFNFILPEYGADRCGILKTKNGNIFAVAQWFPRMCVFDDVKGWNTDPYLGPSEFYCEFGDYNYSITAPENHIVVASGVLQNPKEVFSNEELKSWENAKKSEATIMIRNQDAMKKMAAAKTTKTKTWKFKMNNSRDVAWSSSAAFIYDAAKMNLPDNKTGLAQSVYPEESAGNKKWGRSTEYTKGSIENYSKRWMAYPYEVATNVASNISGMEYPGIVFCGYKASGAGLFGVTDHEFGHTWFPMIVGSNERLFGWMDEGFNTFINTIAEEDFNKGEYKSREMNGQMAAAYLFGPTTEGIALAPDAMKERNIGASLYSKPGYALTLLRNEILGKDRFDYAFKTYINDWAYKHPTPKDFFRVINNAAGENLHWFWKAWFEENYSLDMAIKNVELEDGNKTALVTLVNLDRMAMPVLLSYTTTSGKIIKKTYPVDIWNNTDEFIVKLVSTEAIKSVSIDAEKIFPDTNFKNNNWPVN